MHVAGVTLDLNWFLQFIFTLFIIAVGLLHLVKNTASKYFEVDASFEGDPSDRTPMPAVLMDDLACVVCGNSGPKKCSRCKAVRYCSQKCQEVHWKSGHKKDCKTVQSSASSISTQNALSNSQFKASGVGGKTFHGIALIPAHGSQTHRPIKQSREILFPYDEFVELFNWEKPGFPPCGLLNCGNSCFANVVLQCLASTRPLVAYLLEKGHQAECIHNDWCFLCEFQTHLERASQSSQPFSPTNIISRLPNIGGNLGYGRQEDAHEFMRFAIDTMQSVCLEEFGGEKCVPPSSQETTIIQHIFGGHLQSQVICTECNNISNQYENMMDLTVEIHGEARSLEECLDQFTVKEWLHGENMYKCDGCNDYVKAWKRLTVKQAPNILTIALKRFQSGRFGKLNKRVTFPETLDLSPYMSDAEGVMDVYKLYAVVVHVDMLNASFFGHYICYTMDLAGNWYRIDDCKVTRVELDEVLSQGAYMLLYSRVKARPSCLRAPEPSKEEQQMVNVEVEVSPKEKVKCFPCFESVDSIFSSGSASFDGNLCPEGERKELPIEIDSESVKEHSGHTDVAILESSVAEVASSSERESYAGGQNQEDQCFDSYHMGLSVSDSSKAVSPVAEIPQIEREDQKDMDVTYYRSCQAVEEVESSCFEKGLPVSDIAAKKDYEDIDMVDCESGSFIAKNIEIYSNGDAYPVESALLGEYAHKPDAGLFSSSSMTLEAETLNLKHRLPLHGNGIKNIEIIDDNS
ncbi:Ubiquitinyl hydrolase [Parasponia andersonii]|uniref:ubiquitinyl hydrolase 1 n=1 Tax=Parasponia andersonii TaxID=3476 RepID=A0A2P5DIM6_PARAD|nr:Ubiquitinyl hydrolase [Parasponia andersonii]